MLIGGFRNLLPSLWASVSSSLLVVSPLYAQQKGISFCYGKQKLPKQGKSIQTAELDSERKVKNVQKQRSGRPLMWGAWKQFVFDKSHWRVGPLGSD